VPSPGAPRARIRWGLGDFCWIWPATIVAQGVVASLVVAVRGLPASHDLDALDVAVLVTASAVFTVGLVALASTRGRGSLAADFGLALHPTDWPWLVVGVLLSIGGYAVVSIIGAVSGDTPEQEVARALTRAGVGTRLLGAVAVVVFAPLAEELLFRGLLLRALARRVAAPVAVLAGGALFAVAHLLDPDAASLLAPLMLLGVVSGIRAVRTGDLSQSLALHAGFNLLSAVVLLLE
jgi:membrane protease YdiL (CAAX protease family)